jgi:hypothetical protein
VNVDKPSTREDNPSPPSSNYIQIALPPVRPPALHPHHPNFQLAQYFLRILRIRRRTRQLCPTRPRTRLRQLDQRRLPRTIPGVLFAPVAPVAAVMRWITRCIGSREFVQFSSAGSLLVFPCAQREENNSGEEHQEGEGADDYTCDCAGRKSGFRR